MTLLKYAGASALILAASTSHAGLLEVLRDNGSITGEQYEELKKDQADDIQIHGGSKLKFKSPGYEYNVVGRFYQDFAAYQEDETELSNGSELRTARIELKGKFYDNWKFKTQYGFDKDRTQTRYVWLGYQFDNSILKVGRMAESNGMESNASSRYITFMERGLPATAFEYDFAEGLEYRIWGDDSQLTLSALLDDSKPQIQSTKDENGDLVIDASDTTEDSSVDAKFRVHARYSIAPINEDGKVVHLGAWVNHVNPPSDTSGASSRFETHIDGKLLSTSVTGVDGETTGGLEFAWVNGPLSVQAEYMTREIEAAAGGTDVSLNGYYAHVSYFLTGESRKYYHDYGSFDRVSPNEKKGAVQVALRVSELDFSDNDAGTMNDVTLGVNWWPTKNIKFALNQVFAEVEDRSGKPDEEVGVTQVRAQIDF